MSIPNQIFTIWLNDTEEPSEDIQRWINSQKIPGYDHALITLADMPEGLPYVDQAIAAKQWVKAVDYLRMYYLYMYGGWFLDADVEILPGKNFDYLADNKIVAAREANGFIGCAVMGAEPGQMFIDKWADEVEANFRGDDGKYFESSMDILVRGYYEKDWPKDGFTLVPTKIFYPYDWQTNKVDVTPGTITYHHFNRSWV